MADTLTIVKVVDNLPTEIIPNAMIFVRIGPKVDIYITDKDDTATFKASDYQPLFE